MAWIMSVQTIVLRVAENFNIPFIMFGEEGEIEYGGTSKLKNKFFYDLDECIDLYFSGNKPDDFLSEYSKEETFWWTLPSKEKFKKLNPIISKYSFFENWDSYEHYLVAKEK